jgi:hypothetical protein
MEPLKKAILGAAAIALAAGCSLETPSTREALCKQTLYCDNRCGHQDTECLGLAAGTFNCVCSDDAACVHRFCAGDASAHLEGPN